MSTGPTYRDIPIGSRAQLRPQRYTGSWSIFRPVVDKEKCTKCGACWVCCFLGVIRETEDGYFEIDHEYCRPCGICAQVCPVGAIEFRAESSGADKGGIR